MLQTNLHIACTDENQAQRAIAEAFKLDISDVIAVDYWSENLDAANKQARTKALAEAKDKAAILLAAVFEQRPRPCNVQEVTRTLMPHGFYRSFENVYAQNYTVGYRDREVPQIAAFRPKNSFYAGFAEPTDVQDPTLPMRPQISVVSTVRLYFVAPERPAPKEPEKR
jgi:hypothetical protein